MKTETSNQPNSIALPVARKWGCCPDKPPGKIQLNRVRDALRDLGAEHYTSIEKRGIIGVTDGYEAESSYATQRYSIGGTSTNNPTRPEVTAAQNTIGEKYGWTVSRDNAKDIAAEILAAMPALEASRPVNDERQTQEQADAAKAERIAENQASQARDEQRAKADRDIIEAAFGEPGRTVDLQPGQTAIVAQLCFDNSHYQSDYFDSHARLGVPLLLAVSSSSRETEAAARDAVNRFPGLSDMLMEWSWKTEKYSMGHGNYLTGKTVEVPATVGALRQCYGGGTGPIVKGHWEIQFRRAHGKAEAMSVFKGYGNPPAPATGEARPNQGGALGTVKRNLEHDGVEIAFDAKPSDSLRDSLKRAGFRITRRPPWRWYRKYSAAAWDAACELAGVKGGNAEESRNEPGLHNPREGEDEAAGFEPGTLASDRRSAEQGVSVVRFASGDVMTQNSRGRCEDAPCCGCCT